jgi:hypothetical protein
VGAGCYPKGRQPVRADSRAATAWADDPEAVCGTGMGLVQVDHSETAGDRSASPWLKGTWAGTALMQDRNSLFPNAPRSCDMPQLPSRRRRRCPLPRLLLTRRSDGPRYRPARHHALPEWFPAVATSAAPAAGRSARGGVAPTTACTSRAAPSTRFESLLVEGLSSASLARVLGVCPGTISRWIKRASRHARAFADEHNRPSAPSQPLRQPRYVPESRASLNRPL